MTLTPVTFGQFGGLNLRDDPYEVGATGAVNLNNVDFDRRGRLRTRTGRTRLTDENALSARCMALVPIVNEGNIAAVVCSGALATVDKITSVGVVTGGVTWTAETAGTPAKLSTPTSEAVYVPTARPAAVLGVSLRKWDGTTLSTVTGKPMFVGVTGQSNRLAQAGFFAAADSPTTTGGSRSAVFFSDPGAPETWSTNNFVDLTPGDGETIQGVVSFSNELYVFKRSNLFVFYGESTDADGEPVFNYRRVPLADKLRAGGGTYSDAHIAAGPDGVYFMTPNGLFRTAGGTPQQVPTPVDPILRWDDNQVSASFNSDLARFTLGWYGSRLHLGYTDTGRFGNTLVWDTMTNQWTSYGYEMTSRPILFERSGIYPFMTFAEGFTAYYVDPDETDDNGTAIAWTYTSGKYPLADPGTVAVTPESSIVGSGTVSLRLDSDTYTNQTGTVTLGTAPATAEGWPAGVDQEGDWLQYTLSGTSHATVNELTHFVSSQKPVGVE